MEEIESKEFIPLPQPKFCLHPRCLYTSFLKLNRTGLVSENRSSELSSDGRSHLAEQLQAFLWSDGLRGALTAFSGSQRKGLFFGDLIGVCGSLSIQNNKKK